MASNMFLTSLPKDGYSDAEDHGQWIASKKFAVEKRVCIVCLNLERDVTAYIWGGEESSVRCRICRLIPKVIEHFELLQAVEGKPFAW
jgi:hypothetical protein